MEGLMSKQPSHEINMNENGHEAVPALRMVTWKMKEFLGKSEGYTPSESYDVFAALQACVQTLQVLNELGYGLHV